MKRAAQVPPSGFQKGLQRLFGGFNARYFGGRLPGYRIVLIEPAQMQGVRAEIDRRERKIRIRADGGRGVVGALLHEMGHAASNAWHGPMWLGVMRRLLGKGAPLADSDRALAAAHTNGRRQPRVKLGCTGGGTRRRRGRKWMDQEVARA